MMGARATREGKYVRKGYVYVHKAKGSIMLHLIPK